MNKFFLIILDGWGIGDKSESDAIYNARTPYLDSLMQKYPNSELLTSGENVGLPHGQMGNSEVGHMNIGAGRVVFQDFVRINKAVETNSIAEEESLKKTFEYAKKNNKDVHFIGLVSEGGVHSSQRHLYKLCEIAQNYQLSNVYIHAITDGRDTDPKSGLGFVGELEKQIKNYNAQISTLIGRYYSMDRDKRWERVKLGYDLMVNGEGKKTDDIIKSIKDSYKEGITDEFIKPISKIDKNGEQIGRIKDGDAVICFNFRTDRLREMTQVLSQQDFPELGMYKKELYYTTMTSYDKSFEKVNVIFDKENIKNTIGEVISLENKKQIRIAETEKYAHVTFFFSGGREKEFEGEKRILIPSPKVTTYDLKPEMSAIKVKDAIIKEIKENQTDFVCLNFANGDMVGHTGVYKSIIKAIETVDKCLEELVEEAIKQNFELMIIADHGNADYAINKESRTPNTAHSQNPVPCVLISDRYKKIKNGILADIAPTILSLMRIKIPEEMTGNILI